MTGPSGRGAGQALNAFGKEARGQTNIPSTSDLRGQVTPEHRAPWRRRLLVLALLLVGVGLRMPGIGVVPPGLYHDEAQNGLDALDVLAGNPQIYFAANNGREPMFIYLVSASVAMLGRTPLAIRLPSLYAGILTLAATYDLARVLWRRRVGLWALAALSATFWHVHLSRVGFRAVLMPLFTALFLAQVVRALRECPGHDNRRRHWVAAGVLFGAGWYTYMAARFTPVAVLAMLVYGLCFHRQRVVRAWRGIALAAFAALLVMLPLGIYTLAHPEVVLARSGQVSIFSEEINHGAFWASLGKHTLRTLGMFTVQGDRIWRHNLALRPVWGPALALAAAIGMGIALAGARRDAGLGLTLVWTIVMALPTLLAEDAPHFLRGVGVLPTAALLPALGLEWLSQRLASLPVPGWSRNARWLPALLVGLATLGTAYDYFVRYNNAPQTYHWFEAGPVQMAAEINRLRGRGWDGTGSKESPPIHRTIYVDRQLWETWSALPYLVPESEVTFLPADAPVDLQRGAAFFVWPYRNWTSDVLPLVPRPAYLQILPGPMAQGDLEPHPTTVVTIFQADTLPELPTPIATFENGVLLRAALVYDGADGLQAGLWWESPPAAKGFENTDYTVFVHYHRDADRVAQHDGQPGLGYLPTSDWVPGDLIMDVHPLPGVEALPDRDRLRIGLYRTNDSVGLGVVDQNGVAVGEWVEVPVIMVAAP